MQHVAPLPTGHKLDRTIPPDVALGIVEARQAMIAFASQAEVAQAKLAAEVVERRRAKAREQAARYRQAAAAHAAKARQKT